MMYKPYTMVRFIPRTLVHIRRISRKIPTCAVEKAIWTSLTLVDPAIYASVATDLPPSTRMAILGSEMLEYIVTSCVSNFIHVPVDITTWTFSFLTMVLFSKTK